MTIIALAGILAALAVVTLVGTAVIDRAYPPGGRFVEVEGGRLHLLELGQPSAPTVVLLHGASGNLRDMQLALGERLAARYRVILIDRPGHGWSDRPDGRADSSPLRQAELIHQALARIGVTRAVFVGHSWSGALVPAYALAYPGEVAGMVLLAPVTHPWPGGVGSFNEIVTTPVIGPLLAHTLVLPLGYFLISSGIQSVFSPQTPPPDYAARTAVNMILRPSEFVANAQDLVDLKAFIIKQAPHYGEITAPTAIISGDEADHIVSTRIHSRAIAAMLPHATLTVLPGIGHMVHYEAADRVIEAIDDVTAQASR
jgi:pimeloyl-ACP methyl ester carboxylesterase